MNLGKTGLTALLAILALGVSANAQEKKDGEKPIAHGRLAGVGPAKPIYQSDLKKDVEGAKAKVDKMVEQIAATKLNPEKDATEKMFEGAISLARHETDIAELRNTFTRCVAAMQNQIQEKKDSGTATAKDNEQFEKCLKHCDETLAMINNMHLNASRMGTATRQQYVLDGWDKHQKGMKELQKRMGECAAMMKETMACCEMPKKEQK